jgi:hypothetical protein
MDWKSFLLKVAENLDAAQKDRLGVTIREIAENADAITAAAQGLDNPLGNGLEGMALILVLAAFGTARG